MSKSETTSEKLEADSKSSSEVRHIHLLVYMLTFYVRFFLGFSHCSTLPHGS